MTGSDPLGEIRQLYFKTSPSTIQHDFERAIDLLKSMKSQEERQRAAVYMDGLNELRKEWRRKRPISLPDSDS
jgi:hypothetical protein